MEAFRKAIKGLIAGNFLSFGHFFDEVMTAELEEVGKSMFVNEAKNEDIL